MRASCHRVTGLAAGVAVWSALASTGPLAVLAIPAGLAGGNAPDRIEWIGSRRWCGHRTITHWFFLWAAIFCYGAATLHELWGPALLGYGAGGLTHLCFDVPNIMGVPVLSPVHRIAFRWWKSGDHDLLLTTLCIAIAAAAVWLRLR